jgi:hypothetical protein
MLLSRDTLLTAKQTAELLQMHERTFRDNYTKMGLNPIEIIPNRKGKRWSKRAVERYIAEQERKALGNVVNIAEIREVARLTHGARKAG